MMHFAALCVAFTVTVTCARAGLTFSPPVVVGYGSQEYCVGYRSLGDDDGVIVGPLAGNMVGSVDGGQTWRQVLDGKSVTGGTVSAFRAGNVTLRTFGSMGDVRNRTASYTGFWANDTVAVHYDAGAGFTVADVAANITFRGTPFAVTCGTSKAEYGCPFRLSGTGVVRLANGDMVHSVIVYSKALANPTPAQTPFSTSVVAYGSSDNGTTWRFRGVVAAAADVPFSQEGPNENDLTVYTPPSGPETIVCVVRLDAGDGFQSHPYVPYHVTTSTDGGRTWSKLVSLGAGVGCARPRLITLGGTTLLLAGGRLGPTNRDVLVWQAQQPTGPWVASSITYHHNLLEPNATLRFTAAVNDSTARETTSYTSLIALSSSWAVLTYSRVLPPAPDVVFAMQFQVATPASTAASADAPTAHTVPLSCNTYGNCSAAIVAGMQVCGASPVPCTVVLQAGTYKVSGPVRGMALRASGLSNILLRGAGSTATTLLSTSLTGFFAMSEVHNLTLEGFAMDMVRQPYTLGVVTTTSASGFTMAVNTTAYPPPGAGDTWLTIVQATMQYDPVRRRPAVDGLDSYAVTNCTWGADGTVTVALPAHGHLVAGDTVIVRHQVYSLNGVTVQGSSTNVTARDVVVASTPGMAFYFEMVDGVTLDGCGVRRRRGRPMSSTADASHFNSCKGRLLLRDCVMEGQGDDGCNMHGKWAAVATTSPDRLRFTWAPATASAHGQFLATVGDVLEFRDRDTMATVGTAVLTAVDAANATASVAAPLPAGVGPGPGTVVRSLTWQPSSATVDGCVFANNRARGVLAKVPNTLITNTTFNSTSGPAVLVAIDTDFWFESGPVDGWAVRNCTVHDVNYGPAANRIGDVIVTAKTPEYPSGLRVGHVHTNVTVARSRFVQRHGQGAVAVFSADGVAVVNNWVVSAADQPRAAPTWQWTSVVHGTAAGNVCAWSNGTVTPCERQG